GTVWGTDLNSAEQRIATTEYGGKGSFTVQTPAAPSITWMHASVGSATVSQQNDWTVAVAIRNAGGSDIDLDLDPAYTYLDFSTSADFVVIQPAGLAGGGTVLEGGAVDTLLFVIDQTGSVSGPCTIDAVIASTEINSGRSITPFSAPISLRPVVAVEGEASLVITEIDPLQDPVTIGQAAQWAIDMSVMNSGGSAVDIDTGDHDSTFVDIAGGTGFVLGYPSGLQGGGTRLESGETGTLRFQVLTTGTAPPGKAVLTGAVKGVEVNSARTVYTSVGQSASADSVEFDYIPDPLYRSGSLRPLSVSSGTDITIEASIESSDPDHATLILDPDRSNAWFGDADGDTVRTTLSGVSPMQLTGGASTSLIFKSTTVDPLIDFQAYTVGLHLEGTENGNPFVKDIDTAPDQITVEEAPQLSITSIIVPASVTAGLQPSWDAKMVLHNNGEASVEMRLHPDSTNISISIVGSGQQTDYSITWPDRLERSQDLILAGGQVDTLTFVITGTGWTTGTALLNGSVTARDINSSEMIVDDTYTGGGSFMSVQSAADPVIVSAQASTDTVTSGQTTPWTMLVRVENRGQASLTLEPDSTMLFADYALTVPAPPVTFVEGGATLAGGQTRTLAFEVTPTPDIPGGYDLVVEMQAAFHEDNRNEYIDYDTRGASGGSVPLRVQAPAELQVTALECAAPNSPRVNRNQNVPLVVRISNNGEACVRDLSIGLTGDGTSTVADSPLLLGRLCGAGTVTDTFHVDISDIPGTETFEASILSAVDVNSGQTGLLSVSAPVDYSETVQIEEPGDLSVVAVTPSQAQVNAGQTADWRLRVDLSNEGEAPVTLDAPAIDDISFYKGTTLLGDYLVVPPAGFGSGATDLTLETGETDSLIYIISTTGLDTGIVETRVSLGWIDGNEPSLGTAGSSGSGSVLVKTPSGLRIISISSNAPNNAMFPNTSIVNATQVFELTVTVENTGGDDLEQVEVDLVTNGAAVISSVSGTPLLGSGAQGEFVFSVQSPTPGIEILTASIVRAVSVNTGLEVPPIQAIESIENLQVQVAAVLSCDVRISSPAGAVDDTLSTSQQFVLTALVENMGEAGEDRTGQLTLSMPAGFARVYPDSDSLVTSFEAGEEISWTLTAPADATSGAVSIGVEITRAPRDVNIMSPAFVLQASDIEEILVEEAASIDGCSLVVTAPAGAEDATISTGQVFTVRAEFDPSLNSVSNWVELSVPAGFDIDGQERIEIAGNDGQPDVVTWEVSAPSSAVSSQQLSIGTGGTDMNTGLAFPGCVRQLEIDVVEHAVLGLSAFISGPPQATEGNLSANMPFTIEAGVVNTGTAGVDTSGARLEIILPADYTLDGPGET
ncbi:MAG TPA: hypothetical protein VLA34_09790, partial [Candidatus Krumholzibacterium sp.]|nr:hypothetical protein [Candidatus Krumholzibacterium sp.]